MRKLRDQTFANQGEPHTFARASSHDMPWMGIWCVMMGDDAGLGLVDRDDEEALGIVGQRLALAAAILSWVNANRRLDIFLHRVLVGYVAVFTLLIVWDAVVRLSRA
jgi:hypothetical protein